MVFCTKHYIFPPEFDNKTKTAFKMIFFFLSFFCMCVPLVNPGSCVPPVFLSARRFLPCQTNTIIPSVTGTIINPVCVSLSNLSDSPCLCVSVCSFAHSFARLFARMFARKYVSSNCACVVRSVTGGNLEKKKYALDPEPKIKSACSISRLQMGMMSRSVQ